MEKLCYALWRTDDLSTDELRSRLLDLAAPAIGDLGVAGLRMQVEDPAGDLLRYGANPHGDRFCATVSVWLQSYDDRPPVEEAITGVGCRTAGWLVTESRPIECTARDWPDGERSPGLTLCTLLTKRPDISDDDFYGRWHGSHTPLTFDIHPFWVYLRNAIVRPVTPSAPPYMALVEEGVGDAADMTDLMRFYRANGSPEQMKVNMDRMNEDLNSFCDMTNLETLPAGEWILRSGPGD
jgi:hypothetical protein